MATRTKKPNKKKADPAPPQGGESPESIEQVRDILFGGQMRAVESRLARMEERFHREHKAMQADLEKHMSRIEQFAKKEFEATGEKLREERARRGDDLKAVRSELRDASSTLDKRLAKLDESTSAADAELRTQVLEHSKLAADRHKQLTEQFMAELDRALTELRAEKVDTAALLDIFSQVAVRLTEELQSPHDT